MQEKAAALFPAHGRIILCVVWTLCVVGLVLCCGIGMRSLCGMILVTGLLWLSFIDLHSGMLYDVITLPLAVLGMFFSLCGFLVSIEDGLLGGTLCGVLFYCLYIAARGGLGGGDVKLALAIGVWLGWQAAIIAVWTAFVLGGIAAAILLLTGRRGRWEGIPFGPFLSVGGYIGFLAGAEIWQIYWGLF